MSFDIYDGRRFKSPIRWGLLALFCGLSVLNVQNILDQQTAFDEQVEHLSMLQSELKKSEQKARIHSLAVNHDDQTAFELMHPLINYSNEKIRLSKLDFKKTTKQLDITGDVLSLDELAQFKDWLMTFQQVKQIEVVSNAYLNERQQYHYNFSMKVML